LEPKEQLRESDVVDESDARHDRALLNGFEVERSAYNISVWNGYLPVDCVDTMIKMGWDYST
jgi:hypothetical protein